MSNTIKDKLTFPVTLTKLAHFYAQSFYKEQSDPQKGKQIYLNTLAVYAVNYFLNCSDVETDLEASYSWNPVLQTLTNVSDLVIKENYKIECLPVLPGQESCYIPQEIWSERIGFVAVQLDEELSQAKLLGFIKQVNVEQVSIDQFKSLEELPGYLKEVKPIVNLSQWLDGMFETAWKTVEEVWEKLDTYFEPPQVQPATRSSVSRNPYKKPEVLADVVKRGKLIDLRGDGNYLVGLFVGLKPVDKQKMQVSIEAYPIGNQKLAQNLQLIVLDEADQIFMQAQAKTPKKIYMDFKGPLDEYFSVKIVWGELSLTESFSI